MRVERKVKKPSEFLWRLFHLRVSGGTDRLDRQWYWQRWVTNHSIER